MSLAERLRSIAERLPSIREQIESEEATKNALVLPFLQALGYNVFDLNEVVPEFTADVGIKRGEKVDYAILHGGAPIILIECKCCGADLSSYGSQLYRYFSVTPARLGILTDGVVYRLYSDLREPNKMDEKPFLDIDLCELNESSTEELAKLSKAEFDLDSILEAARRLKHTREIRRVLASEIAQPSDDFVRFFVERLCKGRITQNVLDRFRPLVQTSITEHVTNMVEKRLKAALAKNQQVAEIAEAPPAAPLPDAEEAGQRSVETTIEELEAYYIVKAVVRDLVAVDRVVPRDVKTYFSVLLDDNNRKPICRFWFNGPQKYVGVFDADKKESRIAVDSPEEIFDYADRVRESLAVLLK